jgi:hypothetical protein
MPWRSDKQRRWGNSPAGLAAMGRSKVDEFNQASKGITMKEEKESPKKSSKDRLHEVAESAMMGKRKKKMPMDKLDAVKMKFMVGRKKGK